MAQPLRVVILKPSKYTADGYVERFRWGFMPNSTVPYVRAMTPSCVGGTAVDVHPIFNKYPEAEALLTAMEEEQLGLRLFVQCDTQIARQEHLVALLAKAGCFQMFVGVEPFNRLCREHGSASVAEACWRSRRRTWAYRCSAGIARGGRCIPCPGGFYECDGMA